MKVYRVYCFGVSRVVSADWVEAADDAEALNTARQTLKFFSGEVWDRDRLVGRYQNDEA